MCVKLLSLPLWVLGGSCVSRMTDETVFLHIPPVVDIFTWLPVLFLSSEKLELHISENAGSLYNWSPKTARKLWLRQAGWNTSCLCGEAQRRTEGGFILFTSDTPKPSGVTRIWGVVPAHWQRHNSQDKSQHECKVIFHIHLITTLVQGIF